MVQSGFANGLIFMVINILQALSMLLFIWIGLLAKLVHILY